MEKRIWGAPQGPRSTNLNLLQIHERHLYHRHQRNRHHRSHNAQEEEQEMKLKVSLKCKCNGAKSLGVKAADH